MKKRKIIATGKIVKGSLSMFMGEVKEWFKLWPDCKVIVTFEVLQPKASEAIKGYYYKYIVPAFVEAFKNNGDRKTESQVDLELRKMCPVMWEQVPNETTGGYMSTIKHITEISNPEMVEFIETLRELAAVEFGFEIKDPNTF